MSDSLASSDYERLLAFRDQLRGFLHWSEQQAVRAGITPAQYQLLLAVRGHKGGAPTIRDAAEHLLLQHHSVVGLVDRAESAGLVERRVDAIDRRVVRLALTGKGARLLARLAAAHLDELARRPLEIPLPRAGSRSALRASKSVDNRSEPSGS